MVSVTYNLIRTFNLSGIEYARTSSLVGTQPGGVFGNPNDKKVERSQPAQRRGLTAYPSSGTCLSARR